MSNFTFNLSPALIRDFGVDESKVRSAFEELEAELSVTRNFSNADVVPVAEKWKLSPVEFRLVLEVLVMRFEDEPDFAPPARRLQS